MFEMHNDISKNKCNYNILQVCCTFKQGTQYWMTIMYMFLFGEKSFCMDFAHT